MKTHSTSFITALHIIPFLGSCVDIEHFLIGNVTNQDEYLVGFTYIKPDKIMELVQKVGVKVSITNSESEAGNKGFLIRLKK